jgi:hypothetical protein
MYKALALSVMSAITLGESLIASEAMHERSRLKRTTRVLDLRPFIQRDRQQQVAKNEKLQQARMDQMEKDLMRMQVTSIAPTAQNDNAKTTIQDAEIALSDLSIEPKKISE